MNPKQQEAMAKRLVELLIKADVFEEKRCSACILCGINTDMHTWIAMKKKREKRDLIRVIKHAIITYEAERLAKAWAKHKLESGT